MILKVKVVNTLDSSQLLKGILQACIISVISEGETYGYQIIQDLTEYGFNHVKDGTLYPILSRLQKKKLIQSRIGESPLGPKRKYFSVTEEGLDYLNSFRIEFDSVVKIAKTILNKGDDDNEA